MGVKDDQKSILDQLTAAATAPQPAPAELVSKLPPLSTTPAGPEPPISLADASASAPGSIANLEDESSNPARNSEAVKASEQKGPGFLSKLKDFAGGMLGLESPEENPAAEKGARVAGLAGRTGNALALAAGTPEQKQIAEENSQIPLKLAQIQNEREYRRALIGTKNDTNEINQQKADQQKQAADARMRLKGYVPDEQSPGAYRVMNEDEILGDPVLSKNQGLQQAATASKSAGALLALARRDALMNPDNPTLQLKAKQIENTYKLAQAHLAMQLHNQGRQDQEFLYNYGQTPGVNPGGATPPAQGGAQEVPGAPGSLNINNAADSMMVNPTTGMPIPMKMLSTLKPTQQEQNRADFAASAIHTADILNKMYQDAQAKIGPAQGRLADYMAKAGFGDKFNQEIQNYIRFAQSAATAAHTGRFSVPILEKMDKMIGPQMGADQFAGALDSIKTQMSPYADAGWKPTVREYRDALANNTTLKTPSGKAVQPVASKTVPSYADWKKSQAAAGSK